MKSAMSRHSFRAAESARDLELRERGRRAMSKDLQAPSTCPLWVHPYWSTPNPNARLT